MSIKTFSVYIMASHGRTLYVGVTSGLLDRVYQHKQKLIPGFTRRYNIVKLVYFEEFATAAAAFSREKQIKGWTRDKKVALVESKNPEWRDLSEGWFLSLEDAIRQNQAKSRKSMQLLKDEATH